MSVLVFVAFFAVVVYVIHSAMGDADAKFAARSEGERRKLAEALTERLVEKLGVGSRQLDSEKKSCLEDEDAASFENVELSLSETAQ